MSHSHSHEHEHPVSSLKQALFVTGFFLIIEFAGGWISNSLALLSDAGHMLTDVGSLLLSLFAAWIARRPPRDSMSFGYHRAEILGALFSGLSIWALAGVLCFEAYQRFSAPVVIQGPVVLVIAGLGLAVNLFSLKVLHRHKDHHLNVKGAYFHVLADALGSVGALLAGAAMTWAEWFWVDPVVTFLLAALMLFASWSLIRDSVAILMESTPSGVNLRDLKEALAAIPSVKEVHDLHVWAVGSSKLAMSVHLVTPNNQDVMERVQELLVRDFGIKHSTIQIEDPENPRSEFCYDCGSSVLSKN